MLILTTLFLKAIATAGLAASSSGLDLHEPDARILGTYKVTDIRLTTRKGTISQCVGGTPDPQCGRLVQAIRKDGSGGLSQLELLDLRPVRGERKFVSTFLFTAPLVNRKCDDELSLDKIEGGLFSSRICRGFHVPRLDTKDSESFVFHPGLDPFADSLTRALLTFSVSGLPLGISSADEVLLPKDDPAPSRITAKEVVMGVLLFVPAKITYAYTLERVGD